jgi:hypothetical protein
MAVQLQLHEYIYVHVLVTCSIQWSDHAITDAPSRIIRRAAMDLSVSGATCRRNAAQLRQRTYMKPDI